MAKEIFVLGACHHNTLGVIRSLGMAGITPKVVIVRHNKSPYIVYSKYIGEKWVVDTNDEAISILLGQKKAYDSKPIVIACSDSLSSLVDENSKKLSVYYDIPGNGGTLTPLMNKSTMSELAAKIGFTVPYFVTTTTETKSVEIPFPWIIKPLVSKDGQKDDIERVYTQQDWDEYCKARHTHDVQVQQLVEKEYEYQLIGISLNKGEEVVVPGVSVVLRPASNTNTGFLRYEPLGDEYNSIIELCKKFLHATGYSGLFSLEFLKGVDGKDYFMEINFRNDGNAICVTAAGVNLPLIWYLFHSGQGYKEYLSTTKVKTVYVMPEMSDLSYIKHGKLSVFSWIKDVFRTDCFMEFSRKDPSPFIHLVGQKMESLIRKK